MPHPGSAIVIIQLDIPVVLPFDNTLMNIDCPAVVPVTCQIIVAPVLLLIPVLSGGIPCCNADQ